MTTIDSVREAFFYKYGSWRYQPASETPEEGHRRSARGLSNAEQEAQERGFYFEWGTDDGGCGGCDCSNPECQCYATGGRVTDEHQPMYCIVRSEPGGEALASLGGICGADANYRRVVQAELAEEALQEHQDTDWFRPGRLHRKDWLVKEG